MNVLVLGGNGFIGGHVVAALVKRGHHVTVAMRRPPRPPSPDPRLGHARVDLARDVEASAWAPRLAGIDAVVNCAGILQARPGQPIDAVHHRGPAALFAACEAAGVRRVVHVSAISARPDADTDYARTKCAGDTALMASALDWVILKPSLVHGAGGYGGTALIRALALFPLAIPLVGDGAAAFNPIHAEDLAADIADLVADGRVSRLVLEPMGPERVGLAEILPVLRHWLGGGPAPFLRLPLPLVRLACRFGDLFGGPMSTTALTQLLAGNDGDPAPYAEAMGRHPRGFTASLAETPVPPEARWQARTYFARPALRAALVLVWLLSGLFGLLVPASTMIATAAAIGLGPAAGLIAGYGFCFVDIAIGLAVLLRYRPGWTAFAQVTVVAGYTLVLGIGLPALWLDPFGPLLKNLAVIAAAVALAGMDHDR
ncbi:SDR family oxidoreductase [Zavarzinia compransoris]|uniref:SDR family oxidoreductase n=1 Tax=Zavarzinia marina TaxID=2911065 RepID=UPI001F2DD01F|nr:SDR family oxidoreductase [Zavarzinia marina]MCF4164215.1 SDR family oxidoreductase [Zavarzinia marina]